MGMAASQARYLALVARKSNCEYEGQQINQSRLMLSNQSANLFNQMLGLQVPVPPSTQDFTKKQYSFTDGVNKYTIDSWNQLAEPDSEGYNYVVNYHYKSSIYTGYQKYQTDPQVQFSTKGAYPDKKKYAEQIANIEAALNRINAAESQYDLALTALKTVQSKAAQLPTYADNDTSSNVTSCKHNDDGTYTVKNTQKDSNGYLIYKTPTDLYRFYKDGSFYIRTGNEQSGYTYTPDPESDTSKYLPESNTKTYTPFGSLSGKTQAEVSDAIQKLKDFKALDSDYSFDNVYYDTTNNTIAFKTDLDKLVGMDSGYSTILPLYYINDPSGKPETAAWKSINGMKNDIDTAQRTYDAANSELDNAKAAYKALNVPSYLGNNPLTPISKSSLTDSQMAEITQILKDMDDNEIANNIKKCFTTTSETYDKDSYTGGLYTFVSAGKTYYTTYFDLADSINGGTGINHIDDQPKLPFYGTDNIDTDINKTAKALLETDSSGRFTSIRFQDDSVKYSLNVETITDENAYKDAMNKYNYENAQYNKMVQDINAKTSIIQAEDQQLELRLKQLETEQNALSTEIDAVAKVVKDNVEKSFKTFSG